MAGSPSNTDRVIDTLARAPATGLLERGDRRAERRYSYTEAVAVFLVSPDGWRFPPFIVQSRDLSVLGIAVTSGQMVQPGSAGAVQLVRSDGSAALVGVTARYCHYLGGMKHATGLEFGPLPAGLTHADFLDEAGRMPVIVPELTGDRTPPVR